MRVRVGLIQMRCEKAAISENLAATKGHIDEAADKAIDILALPEMSITGYVDPTRHTDGVIRLDGPEVKTLLSISKGREMTVLAGLAEHNPSGKPFIAHIVVRDGRLAGYYRKVTIEDEEVPWFSPGDGVPVFRHGDVTFGVAICADIGNEEVFAQAARQGAEIVFEVAAPGLYGDQATRDWRAGFEWWEGECRKRLGRYAKKYGLWIAVATQAGRTLDEDFPGGGYVFAPGGRRVFATTDWEPCAVYLAIDSDAKAVVAL
jgi:predicted amidohydrolase